MGGTPMLRGRGARGDKRMGARGWGRDQQFALQRGFVTRNSLGGRRRLSGSAAQTSEVGWGTFPFTSTGALASGAAAASGEEGGGGEGEEGEGGGFGDGFGGGEGADG